MSGPPADKVQGLYLLKVREHYAVLELSERRQRTFARTGSEKG